MPFGAPICALRGSPRRTSDKDFTGWPTPTCGDPTGTNPTVPLDLKGEGVEALSIPELDKAINKYEKKKQARCEMSPSEITAKGELTALLHQHREALPKNADGIPFYRYEDVDYALEEKLKRSKVYSDED